MAYLIPSETFDNVYQLETTDPVLGGSGGIANLPSQQLTNRTAWLKAQVEAIQSMLASGVQPLDVVLTALSALTVAAANKMIYSTGENAFALTDISAFARTLLDDADAATARATLGAAPIASPTFTGVPAAPTATAGTNSTQLATTAFVASAIANLVASSPAALDTLSELAAALGNDPNFATSIATTLGGKVGKTGNESIAGIKTFTSSPIVPDGDASGEPVHYGQFAASLAASGYQKLPSGLIMQWCLGSVVFSEGYSTVTLPLTFPNGISRVFVSTSVPTGVTSGYNEMFQFVDAPTLGTVRVYRQNFEDASGGIYPTIFAIGY